MTVKNIPIRIRGTNKRSSMPSEEFEALYMSTRSKIDIEGRATLPTEVLLDKESLPKGTYIQQGRKLLRFRTPKAALQHILQVADDIDHITIIVVARGRSRYYTETSTGGVIPLELFTV